MTRAYGGAQKENSVVVVWQSKENSENSKQASKAGKALQAGWKIRRSQQRRAGHWAIISTRAVSNKTEGRAENGDHATAGFAQ